MMTGSSEPALPQVRRRLGIRRGGDPSVTIPPALLGWWPVRREMLTRQKAVGTFTEPSAIATMEFERNVQLCNAAGDGVCCVGLPSAQLTQFSKHVTGLARAAPRFFGAADCQASLSARSIRLTCDSDFP